MNRMLVSFSMAMLLAAVASENISAASDGEYLVSVVERGHPLSERDMVAAFDPSGAFAGEARLAEAARSVLRRVGLFFERESVSYTLRRAAVLGSKVFIAQVELIGPEYEGVETLSLSDLLKTRDAFYFTPDEKIQTSAFFERGVTNYSGGLFRVRYKDDPFWLYGTDDYIEFLADAHGMTNRVTNTDSIVMTRHVRENSSQLRIDLDRGDVMRVTYTIGGVVVWDIRHEGSLDVGQRRVPRTVTKTHYVNAPGLAPVVVKEVVIQFLNHGTYEGTPSAGSMKLAVDREIEAVDYRSGRSIDVYLAPDHAVRPLRTSGPQPASSR